MKSITCASYDYMKLMVSELRRQLEEIDSRNKNQTLKNETNPPKPPPRRQNPFNKSSAANVPSSSFITTTAGMSHMIVFKVPWLLLFLTL